jgi:hypothetical protein
MAIVSVRTLNRRFEGVSRKLRGLQSTRGLWQGTLNTKQACDFVAAVELLNSVGSRARCAILRGGTSSNSYGGYREKEWRLYEYCQDYIGPRSVVSFEYGEYGVKRLPAKSRGWNAEFDARFWLPVTADDDSLNVGGHLSPVAEFVQVESLVVRNQDDWREIEFSIAVGSGEIRTKALEAARQLEKQMREARLRRNGRISLRRRQVSRLSAV